MRILCRNLMLVSATMCQFSQHWVQSVGPISKMNSHPYIALPYLLLLKLMGFLCRNLMLVASTMCQFSQNWVQSVGPISKMDSILILVTMVAFLSMAYGVEVNYCWHVSVMYLRLFSWLLYLWFACFVLKSQSNVILCLWLSEFSFPHV